MPARGAEELSFNRDIRPILARNCYECHGPDEEGRKAKLRLDRRKDAEEVLAPGGELVARITATDEDDVMPPPDSHRHLEPAQIEMLRRWIEEGAPYQEHWAFVPPARPKLPKVKKANWPRSGIDRFVLARLEAEGLAPSAEADRYTLARRLHLDLIGLPPTPEEADAFAADDSPDAYEELVDRLLDSPRYGERWARPWLDLARYADTNGYEKDRPRTIWPYRDWVVKAINADMPFDQFTIEQLAGDMLPGATRDQRVATGFHRNTMINEEGGIDPLEYRYYAMVDRVATTGTVWMGLTTGCAQCHTHKYDPITHTDYFSLMALLNNADEVDLDVPDAVVTEKRRALQQEIAALEKGAIAKMDREAFRKWAAAQRGQAVPWTPVTPTEANADMPRLYIRDDGSVFAAGDFNKREVYTIRVRLDGFEGKPVTALRLDALPDPRLPAHGPGIGFYEGRRGDFFLSEVIARGVESGAEIAFADASHSYGKISVGSGGADAGNVLDREGSTGWSTSEREGEAHHLVLNLVEPLATPTEIEIELLFERHFAAALGRFGFAATTASKKAVAFPSGAPDPFTATDADMKRWFIRTDDSSEKTKKAIAAVEAKLPVTPATLVMRERPPRDPRLTHRHHRGEYLNAEEEVAPAVPAIFSQLTGDVPANRLNFARWLVSDRNPLVARVAVNRAWQAIFGRGLMESAEDFGTQSSPPSHPELLDWLAVEFREGGWSRKQLHRLIVTSATYRQASAMTPQLEARDPENTLLARGPRFRLDGEVVRDQALAASGLLSDKTGGPGVYPPQPESVTKMAYGKTAWKVSAGEDRHRRSLYTFAKRTAPFAAYTVFDAPTGENCVARRERSNTPLQALTLLNDAMYLEMAEALASSALEGGGGERAIATRIFRRFLVRPPSESEHDALVEFFTGQRARFESGELDADAFLSTKIVSPELAAWTLVARAVMNLDEAITKS